MTGMVSVILPTRDRCALLRRAIDSVFAQTWRQWELIIVADACTDATADLVRSYCKDPRVRFLELSQNVGGAEARNRGIQAASGDYIAFLDDDDEWLPRKLEYQIPVFTQHEDAAIVSCCNDIVGWYGVIRAGSARSADLSELLLRNACGSFSFCVTRRQYLVGISIDRSLKAYQDQDLWVRILGKTGMKCYVHEESLVRYHEHVQGRLTLNSRNVFLSYVKFIRNHLGLMNGAQRRYHSGALGEQKMQMLDLTGMQKFGLFCRSLSSLWGSRLATAGQLAYFVESIFPFRGTLKRLAQRWRASRYEASKPI